MDRAPSSPAGFPRSRTGLAVARWLALAPATVLAASASVAGVVAESGAASDPPTAADAVDGRADWRTPARAPFPTRADGRADWAVGGPPRLSAATATRLRTDAVTEAVGAAEAAEEPDSAPANGGPEWVDVVVDGELERVPRLLPAVRPTSSGGAATRPAIDADPAPGPTPPPPSPSPDPVRAVLPSRDERATREGSESVVPGIGRAMPAPRGPGPRDDADGLADWLRRLGIASDAAGQPCLTPEEARAAFRVRSTRAADGSGEDRLGRLLDALSDDVNDHPLEAGVSRDWSVSRFGCEPGAAGGREGDIDIVLDEPDPRGPASTATVDAPTGSSDAGEPAESEGFARPATIAGMGGAPTTAGTIGTAGTDGTTGETGAAATAETTGSTGAARTTAGAKTSAIDGPGEPATRVDPVGQRDLEGVPPVDIELDVDDGSTSPVDDAGGAPAARSADGEAGEITDGSIGGDVGAPAGERRADPVDPSSADGDGPTGGIGPPPIPSPGIVPPVLLPPGGVLPDVDLPDVSDPFGAPPSIDGDEPPVGGAAPGPTNEITSGLFIIDDDDVPAGFEMLAAPQPAFADIRFNGRKVGSTMLTTTADEILFDFPAEVVAMLDDIEDPERLLELLAAPFPPNAERVCFRPGDPAGCGVIEPAPVAVIYDENTLTLDLFVAGALQSVRAQETARFLPTPERRPTSILSLYSSTSKTPGNDAAFDLSARLLAGYGSGHVSASADYGSVTEDARLNELKLTHFSNGHELTAGTYRWGPGGALSDVPLAGVGFSTSFRTRVDLEQAFGTELVVYLRQRAIVQILVDDRVQGGDSYEAGNRVLDTRALPDGTYPIEIRIIESDGSTRSEFRTFTKSTSMPPRGEPVFSATAGVARTDDELFPADAEPLVAGFGVAQRLGERSALSVGAAQLGRDGFGQSEFVYLGETVSLQGAFTIGRERTVGAALNTAFALGETRLGVSYRTFRSDVDRLGDPVRELFYPEDGERWDVTLDRSFGALSVGLSASRGTERVADGDPEDTTRYALRARRPVFRRRDLRGSLSFGLRDDGGERSGSVRFDVSFGREGWRSGLALDALSTRDGDTGFAQVARVDYTGRTSSLDWEAGLRARNSGTSDSAGASASVEHPLFRASAAHDVDISAQGRETASSVATLATQFGFDRHGVAIGGANASRSGVIVDVDGTPEGTPFDIFVNGVRAAVGEIGASRFIGLQPFESYAVKLVPRGVLANGLGGEVHEFTLFPGNVQRIDAFAESRVLLIAELVDERGDALGSAVIEDGDDVAITDSSGFLQAEMPTGRAFEVKPADGGSCTITTPDAAPGTEVLVADEALICVTGPALLAAEPDTGEEGGPDPVPAVPAPAPDARRAPSGRRKGEGSKRGARRRGRKSGGKGGAAKRGRR